MKTHLLSTIILSFLTSISCFACKCGHIELTPDRYFEFTIIFTGHLDTIIEKERGSPDRTITFYIDKIYRGDSTKKITFKNISTGSCWGTYKKEYNYLIYLRYDKKNKTFYTTTCSSKPIKSKISYINKSSQTDTSWNFGATKYREIDFLEKYHQIKGGKIDVEMPNGKTYAKGTITNCLPTGIWTFYDYNGRPVKTINYRRGKKFKYKITCH